MLDDDSLLEIIKRMQVPELLNVSKTCSKLHSLVKKEHTKISFSLPFNEYVDPESSFYFPLFQVSELLSHKIDTITIDLGHLSSNFLSTIEHKILRLLNLFDNNILQSLTFYYLTLECLIEQSFLPLFKNLKYLKIHFRTLHTVYEEQLIKIFKSTQKVETVVIENHHNYTPFSLLSLPDNTLKIVKIKNSPSQTNLRFSQLIRNQQAIHSFHYSANAKSVYANYCPQFLIGLINLMKNLPALVSFEIFIPRRMGHRGEINFTNLAIKKLKIIYSRDNENIVSVIQKIPELPLLEELTIKEIFSTKATLFHLQIITILSTCKKLKKLSLNVANIDVYMFALLSKELPNTDIYYIYILNNKKYKVKITCNDLLISNKKYKY